MEEWATEEQRMRKWLNYRSEQYSVYMNILQHDLPNLKHHKNHEKQNRLFKMYTAYKAAATTFVEDLFSLICSNKRSFACEKLLTCTLCQWGTSEK